MNQSTLRALQLVELLAERGPTSLATIAARLALTKSTAHRFVTTLVQAGYVQQNDGDRTYRLTTRIVGIASKVLEQIEAGTEVAPILHETAELTAQTCHLAILEGAEVVYIAKVEGGQSVVMATRVGGRSCAHSTAVGKVLLAAEGPAAWQRYVVDPGLTRRTARTLCEPSELFEELEQVGRVGYAVDGEENEEGIRCVAAPVRDHADEVVAALSVSGWTLSMTDERVKELVPLVRGQAEKASRRLGAGAAVRRDRWGLVAGEEHDP